MVFNNLFSVGTKAIEENIQDPLAHVRVRFHVRRVENLWSEITTKESPCGTIRSRVDVVFVTRYNHSCRWRSWAVSENCTVLNKSFV